MSPKAFFGLVVGVIVVIAISFWIGHLNTPSAFDIYTKQFNMYQDSVVKPILIQSDSLKRIADKAKASADSTQAVAEKQTGEINKLRVTVSSLRKQNSALADSVITDTLVAPACEQCRRAVVGLTQEVDSLTIVVDKQEARDTTRVATITQLNIGLSASNMRGDSLQKVIINFPAPPKPNKFLGITLPRIPTQYVVVGGIITGFLIKK